MPKPDRKKALFEAARTGIRLEKWHQLEETQLVLKLIQQDAEFAREACVDICPFQHAGELAAVQIEARMFKELVKKIQHIIQEGREAEMELGTDTGFSDA